ncbi:ferredoxin [bacterium]|nr:ferredoxin [bacterium]
MKARTRPRTKPRRRRPDEHRRWWLTYPKQQIQRPVVYELGQRFHLVTNIRQAQVTSEVGIMSLELQGPPAEIKRAIRWLERLRIKVEPVETNGVES